MTDIQREMAQEGPIVFYDGECGLCDRSVKKLVKIDTKHGLRFAALQGDTAAKAFPGQIDTQNLGSMRLLDSSGVYDGSTAALRAFALAGGVWRTAKALLIVPRFIRDGVYRWVATNRFKWFGRIDACMLPSRALRERFLP